MQVANLFQFDEKQHGRPPLCIACEEMLTDFLDGSLGPADQIWFDQHVASCVACDRMVADAQRGAAWLEMLKSPRPEPSASLIERIIAQTSGQENASVTSLEPVIIGQPLTLVPSSGDEWAAPKRVLQFPSFGKWFGPRAGGGFEPRLAMTAAMAFFSIALTLNLSGVRLDQLRASNLSPTKVKQTYYEASADAVRYYDNLRVVRVMESRVQQVEDQNLRAPDRDTPESAPQTTQPQDQKQQEQKNDKQPTSRIETPFARPRFQPVAIRKSTPQEGGLV
jgi:Putative zinc-finger